ncbi:MAG: glycosyltransferase [Lachnospiraceae bacterium]|nr:glycosyltransferase [Lachnospiraceae bacterium]
MIPCYNEKKYIETIVEQVLQTKIPRMEIIIVDDCSTDGNRDILEGKLCVQS